jgi:hypothetical protein
VSPVKIRETKIEKLRKDKNLSKFEFKPESSSDKPVQGPIATQVLVECSAANESLLSSQSSSPTDLSEEQKKFLRFAHFRRTVSAIPGVKKKDLEAILAEHFPEMIASPQGLMDILNLGIDSEAVAQAFQSVDRLSSSVSSLKDTKLSHTIELQPVAAKIANEAVAVASKTIDSLDNLTSILMVLAVVIVMRPTTYREKVLVGVIVLGFVATKSSISDLWHNSSLCSWLSSPFEEEVVPQAFSVDELTSMVVGLLNTYVFLGSGSDLFSPTKLAKVINSISRTEIGVSSLIRTVHLLTSYVHSSIDHYWKGNPWFVTCGHSFIDEFLRESSEILLLHEERKLLDLRSSLDRVRAAVLLGETVAVKIPGSHETVGIRMQVNNSLSEMKRIKKLLLASNFENAGLRAEPTGLLLCGPPGVGKSNSMQHFAHAINALTLSDVDFDIYSENPASAIYTRNAENVFWEGYKQSHNIVFIDDVGQARDIQGSPDNEIMNTIRGINIFDYPLHMAEISSKGNTTFRSKFVMANTNLQNFKFESITQPGAFLRRWDVVVDVIPKDEYCQNPDLPDWKKRFDRSKLPLYTAEDTGGDPTKQHLIGDTKMSPEFCWYYPKRMNKSETGFVLVDKRLEFKEVVFLVYETHLRKERFHKQSLQSLDERLKEYRGQTSDEEEEVQMDDMPVPQADTPKPEQEFDFVSRLNFKSRRLLDDIKYSNREHYHKIFAIMANVYVQSEVLGGMFWLQEAFDHVVTFFDKNGFETDIWQPYGVTSWLTFFNVFSEEIYVKTMLPKPCSPAAKNFINNVELSRTALEQLSIINKTCPTWVSWLYRVYKYTFAHACVFGRMLMDDPLGLVVGIASRGYHFTVATCRAMTRSTLLSSILATGAVTLAFKALSMAIPYIFPTKKAKKSRRDFGLAIAQSDDAEVITAREEFAIAQLVFKAAQEHYDKKVASLKLKLIEEGDNEPLPESDERSNRSHKVKRVIRPKRPTVAQPQSIQKHNSNLISIQKRIALKNTFKFYTPSGSERGKHTHSGYALAVHGKALLFPYHFLSVISSGLDSPESFITGSSLIHLRRTVGDYVIMSLTVDEVLNSYREYPKGEEQDLVIIVLPERFQPIVSCLRFFSTERQIDAYRKIDAILSIPGPGEGITELHSVIAQSSENQQVGSFEYEPYTVKKVFTYASQTSAGDCGSMLFANDKTNVNSIIGMHVAGSPSLKTGFSSQISREFLEAYLEFLGLDDIMPPEVDFVNEIDLAVPNMNVVGETKQGSPYPRSIGRTKIVKSHLHGKVSEVLRAPARLRPFFVNEVRIDPNQLALAKYCEPDVYLSPDTLNYGVESLIGFLRHVSTINVTAEVYSYDMAVLGDDSGYWSAIPRSTSSGYPWNCMSGTSAKTRFWGTEERYNLTNEQAIALEKKVQACIKSARNNTRTLHIFTDSLKDERRSLLKVQAGVTRMISCCPVDLLICFRMYFGAFQKWLVANRIENGMAIGINEHSAEWDVLARKLNRFGPRPNKGAGDHQGFDTKHRAAMSEAVLRVVESFYGKCDPLDQRVRRVLWLEVTNSFHINEGIVYSWFTALPSGIFPTTFYNCCANQILFRMAWMDAVQGLKFPLPPFDTCVYLCVMGDDNVFSVSAQFESVFTEVTLATIFKEYGYVYTPEDKEVAQHSVKLRALHLVSFLKRRFIRHEDYGRMVGPLELNSILDMLQWQKETSNSYADCESLVQTALEELTFYPRAVFEEWKTRLFDAIKSVDGITPPLNSSFEHLIQEIKCRDGEPGSLDFDCLTSDYDALQTARVDQMESERFCKDLGGFFNLTVRTPNWQPQSSSEINANSGRFVHRPVLHRTATTTQSAGNTITDQISPGLTREGVFETAREMPMRSQQTSDTTKSTVDADTPITQIVNYVPLNTSLLDSARTGVSQDVRAFLAKPIVIANGSFTTADTYANFIYTSDGIPQSLLYAQPLWINKLAGNFAFKGTLHLSLQVNATRFQAGRYILGWVPSGGGTDPNKFRRQHTASLTLATQCPHVEIDINCDSEASLIIPHITAQGWAALNTVNSTIYGNNGSIFIAAYEGLLVSTGSPVATWTLFAHFEDVEFCMPVQPQSRSGVQTRVRRKVRIPSEMEQESQGLGPLSTGLTLMSAGAQAMSSIPLISSVAGPMAWATAVAAKVASAFGWSRPHNAAQTMMVQRFISPRLTNVDTADNSTVLGANDSNAIEELPGFAGSNLDEMSLSYLVSISAYWARLNWTTLAVQGATLANVELDPRNYYTTATIGLVPVQSLTPLTYFSGFFALYRGSIRFTFKLVKTEFHTGRLLVVFKPYDALAGAIAGATFAGSAYEHREIIDVRLGNEFTLEFPYMSISPYRPTAGSDSGYGFVYVYILNALECPANVPQTVPILIEVSGGKDFEFAEPCDMSGRPTQVYVPQSGKNVCEIVSEQLGNSSTGETDAPARLCIGERITSIRQLLKRFAVSVPNTSPTPANAHLWNMFQLDMGFVDATGETLAAVTPDTYAYFAACYALERGGLRGKILTQSSLNSRVLTIAWPFITGTILPLASQLWTTSPSTYTPDYLGSQKLRAFYDVATTGGPEFQVPFYNRFASAAVADLIGTNSALPVSMHYSTVGPVPRQRAMNIFETAPASVPAVMRAVSEDYSLGLFISVPPLIGYNVDYVG